MMAFKKNIKVSIDVHTIKAQGPRATMEDRYVVQSLGDNLLMMAVFDGHGGDEVAQMCIEKSPEIMKGLIRSNPDMSVCFRILYKTLDDEAKKLNTPTCGCTAAIAVITKDRIWFSNCGDAMIAVKLRDNSVKFFSQDHKVENERARIEGLGGMITTYGGCARIYGTLNIARSIGDHYMKQFVISDPYVTATSFPKADIDWLMVASDGLWDVYNPEQLSVDLSKHNNDLKELIQSAYTRGSMDNITCVFSAFKPVI